MPLDCLKVEFLFTTSPDRNPAALCTAACLSTEAVWKPDAGFYRPHRSPAGVFDTRRSSSRLRPSPIGRGHGSFLARLCSPFCLSRRNTALPGLSNLAGNDDKGEPNQQRREMPMELAAGECSKAGNRWTTIELHERSTESAIRPARSTNSNPASAIRKLFTGVVGPFCAWKPPLGTCRKNRSVTSTISPKNSNLACLALITSSLPSPAGDSHGVFTLPGANRQIWQLARVPLPE